VNTAQPAVADNTVYHPEEGRDFPFIVDGKEYLSLEPLITGAEIMQRAGIPPEVGLIEIQQDGTQRPVPPSEFVDLKRPHRFRHPPRFARG
jgi:hypothetical protein